MKRFALAMVVVFLFAGMAGAWDMLYQGSGRYTERLCALCDKRIHQWHESSVRWSDGGTFIYKGEHYLPPAGRSSKAISIGPDTSLLVCEHCQKEHGASYSEWIKLHRTKFVNITRETEVLRIKLNQKDNATYKEKQDEIDRLQREIQRLEMEKWNYDGKLESGTSRAGKNELIPKYHDWQINTNR